MVILIVIAVIYLLTNHWVHALDALHLLSNVFIAVGFILLYRAWRVLYAGQREHRLAVTGIYVRLRHPQHVGFLTIMLGFLLQWPTLLTLIMFPILAVVYHRLARREDKDMAAEFGQEYLSYAHNVPAFIPRLGTKRNRPSTRRQHGSDSD